MIWQLLKQGPEDRRSFIDQALLLQIQILWQSMRILKHIVDNQQCIVHADTGHQDSYAIWTDQLWQIYRNYSRATQ